MSIEQFVPPYYEGLPQLLSSYIGEGIVINGDEIEGADTAAGTIELPDGVIGGGGQFSEEVAIDGAVVEGRDVLAGHASLDVNYHVIIGSPVEGRDVCAGTLRGQLAITGAATSSADVASGTIFFGLGIVSTVNGAAQESAARDVMDGTMVLGSIVVPPEPVPGPGKPALGGGDWGGGRTRTGGSAGSYHYPSAHLSNKDEKKRKAARKRVLTPEEVEEERRQAEEIAKQAKLALRDHRRPEPDGLPLSEAMEMTKAIDDKEVVDAVMALVNDERELIVAVLNALLTELTDE